MPIFTVSAEELAVLEKLLGRKANPAPAAQKPTTRRAPAPIATEYTRNETPTYVKSAPLNRVYTARELEHLGSGWGAENLHQQIGSARIFVRSVAREVDGQFIHDQGVVIFYTKTVEKDGVLVGEPCSDEEVVFISYEEARRVFNPANLKFRQPFPYSKGQYYTRKITDVIDGEPVQREERMGLGNTFVVSEMTVTDLFGKSHILGARRIYSVPQYFEALVVSQENLEPGKPSLAKKVYDEFLAPTGGLTSQARLDWLLAHTRAIRAGNNRKDILAVCRNKNLLRLRPDNTPRKDEEGTWGYSDQQAIALYNDLEAFETLREGTWQARQQWRKDNPKVAEPVTEPVTNGAGF